MADSNPMGSGAAVALRIPAHHAAFLAELFDVGRSGIEGDLAMDSPHPRRERAERERDTYIRLGNAIENRVIVPDPDVIQVLREVSESTDALNEYEQATLEHRALCGMLAQVEEGRK